MINADTIAVLHNKIRTIPVKGAAGDSSAVLVGPIRLPVNLGGETVTFSWYSWLNADGEELLPDGSPEATAAFVSRLSSMKLADSQQSSVLVYGNFEHSPDALIRMHSICHTGDIFGSKRCDCGFQLRQSMKMIVENGSGALFYLANHEGRGIGLFSKALAYLLQEEGRDTVEANLELGFADDTRDYAEAIAVLKALRPSPVTLITNNPKKLEALRVSGMNAVRRVPLWGDVSEFNEKYLRTKVARSGHMPEEAAESPLLGKRAQ